MWAVYVPTTYRAPRPGARNSARYSLCPVYIRLAYRHFTFERGFELALEDDSFYRDITCSRKCIHIYIVCRMVWRNCSESFLWINVPLCTQVLKVLKCKNKLKRVITTCYFTKILVFFLFPLFSVMQQTLLQFQNIFIKPKNVYNNIYTNEQAKTESLSYE